MNKTLLLVSLSMLVGCAEFRTAKPYARLSVDWQIDRASDWVYQQERGWNGASPFLNGEFGFETRKGYNCSFKAGTSIFTGAPFKEKRFRTDLETGEEYFDAEAELHKLDVGCGWQWGGY